MSKPGDSGDFELPVHTIDSDARIIADDDLTSARPDRARNPNPLATTQPRRETKPPEIHGEARGEGSSDAGAKLPPPDSAERLPYKIGPLLGAGGIGEVRQAWDNQGREVALKVLLPQWRSKPNVVNRFWGEAKALSKLQRHDHIIDVLAYGKSSDYGPYIAMRLVRGVTLEERVRRQSDELDVIIGFVETAARAVVFAHELGTIHRDLKPSNVMIEDASNHVYLMDFGMVKVKEEANSTFLTQGMSVLRGGPEHMGTLVFMSPEQARDEKTTERTDIFGLGGILCWVLTGEAPCHGKNAYKIGVGEYRDSFGRLEQSGADPPLIELTKRCLAFDIDDRPETAAEVAEALARWRSGKRLERGLELKAKERWSEAEAAFREAIAIRRDSPLAWLHLGLLCKRSRSRWPDARQAFDEALEADPGCVEAWRQAGSMRGRVRDWSGAASCYAKLVDLAPDDPDARLRLAETYRSLGKLDEAESQWREALALAPESPEACYRLGLIEQDRKHWDRAARLLSQAVAVRPDWFDAQLSLGVALAKSSRFADAMTALGRADQLRPNQEQVRQWIDFAIDRWERRSREFELGDVVNGWTLIRQIAQDDWGASYQAEKEGRSVILHVLSLRRSADPALADAIERKLRTLTRIGPQEGWATVLGYGREPLQNRCCFWTEPVDGPPLSSRLEQDGPLWPDDAAQLTRTVADALIRLNLNAQDFSGDGLRPENIVIRDCDGKPILCCDFSFLEADRPAARGSTNSTSGGPGARGLALALVRALRGPDEPGPTPSTPPPSDIPDDEDWSFVPERWRGLLKRALAADRRTGRPLLSAREFHREWESVVRSLPPPIVVSPVPGADSTSTPSLTRALRAAPPWSTLLVQPGVYRESLVLNRPARIMGEGSRESIVLESTSGTALRMATSHAQARGLTIRCRAEAGGSSGYGVDAGQGSLTLEDCDISSDSLACVAVRGPSARATIRGCRISEGRKTGLLISQGAKALVERCEIFANGLVGLQISEEADPIVRDCRIRDGKSGGLAASNRGKGLIERCEICRNAQTGVQISDGADPVIRDCRIHDGANGGILVKRDGRGTIERCEIFANELAGVQIRDGGDPILRDCRIHGGKRTGVWVERQGKGTIERSEIFANQLAGLQISDRSDPIVRDCRIRDGKSGGVLIDQAGRGVIERCAITGNAIIGILSREESDPTIRDSEVSGGAGVGIHAAEQGRGTFERCRIADNAQDGFQISEKSDPTVRECELTRNGRYGVRVRALGRGSFDGCDVRGNGQGAWRFDPGCQVGWRNNRE